MYIYVSLNISVYMWIYEYCNETQLFHSLILSCANSLLTQLEAADHHTKLSGSLDCDKAQGREQKAPVSEAFAKAIRM